MAAVVCFTAGRLSSVNKTLLASGNDTVAFGRSLYFAMRDLEQEGDSQCTIQTDNSDSPEWMTKSAKLRCGNKTIIVLLQKHKSQAELVSLDEELSAP